MQQRAGGDHHGGGAVPGLHVLGLESSTIILAVGCVSFICCRIVAPSFDIITSPLGSWIILSMPFGPSDVLTVWATALAARMLVILTSWPFSSFRFCLAPSLIAEQATQ